MLSSPTMAQATRYNSPVRYKRSPWILCALFLFLVHLNAFSTPQINDSDPNPFSGRITAWGTIRIPLVDPAAEYKKIFALGTSAAAVSTDGKITRWGLGSIMRPNQIPIDPFPEGVVDPVKIVTGMVLQRDGTVIEWGPRMNTPRPDGLSNVVDVAAGYYPFRLALKSDGTVVGWGRGTHNRLPFTVPNGLSNVTQLAASAQALVLKSDGTVFAWSAGPSFSTNPPPEATNIIKIAASIQHNLALRSDGTVIAWGRSDFGQTNLPAGLSNVVAITTGFYHSVALTSQGRVVAWGKRPDMDYGQTDVPPEATNIVSISAEGDHTLALRRDGRIVAWGANSYGESLTPHDFFKVRAIATAHSHGLILRSDGTVAGWGVWRDQTRSIPITIPAGLTNVVAIATGDNYDLALRRDGTLLQWGHQGFPIDPTERSLTNIVAIGAGDHAGFALSAEGRVIHLPWAALSPAPQGLPPFVAVDAGLGFHVGLVNDGTIALWQSNGTIVNDFPPAFTNISSIATGPYHVLARRNDGSVVAMGNNDHGQSTVPAYVSNVVTVAAAETWNVAVAEDGTVFSWGNGVPQFYSPEAAPEKIHGVRFLTVNAKFAMALVESGDTPPALHARMQEEALVLTWPKTKQTWDLESLENFSEGMSWRPAPAQIIDARAHLEAHIPLIGISHFFRLRPVVAGAGDKGHLGLTLGP